MTKDHLKAAAVACCLFGAIACYAFEFVHYHNMFSIQSFLLTALITGLMIGGALSWYLTQNVKDAYDKMRIYVGITVLTIVLMPLFLSWINRFLSFQPPKAERVEFVRQEGYQASRFGEFKGKAPEADGVYTFVIRNGQLKRLKSKGPLFPTAQAGERVSIQIREGALGWELVVVP